MEKYKSGFQGKDAMRSKAEKMMGSFDKDMKSKPSTKARPYKDGGSVKGK